MSMIRSYCEDNLGMSNSNEAALSKTFGKMKTALSKVKLDPFRNVSSVCKDPQTLALLTEAVKLSAEDVGVNANRYVMEDVNRLNTLYENVSASILNEAISNVGDLSPIMINSFGIQERALISTHLPRAVKQVTAKVDNFKLTERIPFIVDLAGNKQKFIDAFVPGGKVPTFSETRMMKFDIPSMDIDLHKTVTKEDEIVYEGFHMEDVIGFDSALESVEITGADTNDDGTTKFEFGMDSLRTPSVEDGTFRVSVKYWVSGKEQCAVIMGQFDLSNGVLLSITSSKADVKSATFKMVSSPETHRNALSVGYDTKHTPVNIPIGEHFEYSISEEFKDASDKYYNQDAMALLTDYMGRAVEQVKDIKTLAKFEELAENAVLKTTFNCTPTTGFAQGKEEYIRREFHPFIEKVCIILKNKVRIPQCHFRVVGNPLDIRVAAAAGVEYIYKRNEQFAGEIAIDYEFSVSSDVHRIFYLSSERVPAGKLMVFLIPNTIENNISTVNHYEYATYVSNKYRGTKSNLPTVMISTRYLTKEYYPVMAVINVVNNLVDNDTYSGTATGTGLDSAVTAKVNYVHSNGYFEHGADCNRD
jgi:hypothetical protein